ncbi:PIN domain-containing protein [Thermofilum adornatum]|uniref:PIN domain-containing protein n=1 Tax=Thermofilum adornatum TaxID=1365176 RepID=UPI000AAC8710|nr:PIN domain-containing protein [Thermofilum adornatum]
MSYIDTSVVVASLDPLDPRRELALGVLEKLRDKRVSELVLAELASIVSRRRTVLHKTLRRIGVRDELAVPVVLLYVLKRFGLQYRRIDGRGNICPLGDFYLPLALAIELSSKVRLKILDLLHLAYIAALKEQGKRYTNLSRLMMASKGRRKLLNAN